MYTLILKIRMNSDECVDDRDEIYRALRTLIAYTHMDIKGGDLRTLMNRALELEGPTTDEGYEIMED